MISERTLKNWRADALKFKKSFTGAPEIDYVAKAAYQLNERLLKLTQELLDHQLIARRK